MKQIFKLRKGLNLLKSFQNRGIVGVADGNKAVAHVSYALSDNIFLFPITPSTPAGDYVDNYAADGRENVYGDICTLDILQSESGVAGSIHGSAAGGSMTTTYTNSQGLLLMIPSLFRIAGEQYPAVFHIAARALCKQAWTIYNDHADFYACRSTGFGMLCSSSVQEAHDLGLISHLVSMESEIPFMHIYDGFRTSHEHQKIDMLEYDKIKELVDFDALEKFKAKALNSENPVVRGSSHPPGIYFQNAELPNQLYLDCPDICKDAMKRFGDMTGRYYAPFEYYGAEDAEKIVVVMCSGADVCAETVDYLNASGKKYGLINVRLYRPWDAKSFLEALPESVKKISVLDKTKESGSFGEPLYLDVVATLAEHKKDIDVIGGRYAVGGKEFTPTMVNAVFENLELENSKNHFSVGIVDDLTHTNLEIKEQISTITDDMTQCVFFGIGGDGTLIANQKAIEIVGDKTDKQVQAFFQHDAKKSLSLTISHLRFSPRKITSRYLIGGGADYVASHHHSYVEKFELIKRCKQDGIFVLNSPWDTIEELEQRLPKRMMKEIAEKNVKFYNIDATKIADEAGLPGRINMPMQTVFFKLSKVLPEEEALEYLKEAIKDEFKKLGDEVVQQNITAVENTLEKLEIVDYPQEKWLGFTPEPERSVYEDPFEIIHEKLCLRKGADALPVSSFIPHLGGEMPSGTTKYDKRKVAMTVPKWIPENCIQCAQCSFVCPHAVIRPFLITDEELANAPAGFATIDCNEKKLTEAGFKFTIQVSPLDCTTCANCFEICPSDAIEFVDINECLEEDKQDENWNFAITLPENRAEGLVNKWTVKGSQLRIPYNEFSGACAGCAESSYVKLVTQYFGDRMVISNPAGCSSIWAKTTPSHPYAKNSKGHGPSYSCPLFENNAEFGFGHLKAYEHQRNQLKKAVERAFAKVDGDLKSSFSNWLENYEDAEFSRQYGDEIKELIGNADDSCEDITYIKKHMNLFAKGSTWIIGGDGWAYDINFGGLIHVLAKDDNFNVLVLDSEIYSNTGGQVSKATPMAATAKFAVTGKSAQKMDLGDIAMSLGKVYVGSVSFANQNHLIKTIKEAEEYDGPSLIISYCPCIGHGITGSLRYAQNEQKLAVKSGYWPLYNYRPNEENPFDFVSKKIDIDVLDELVLNETRFGILTRTHPEKAAFLQEKLKDNVLKRHTKYLKRFESQ